MDQLSIWLTGAMLGAAVLMIVGLLALIAVNGLGAFWPKPLWRIERTEGTPLLGLLHRRETIPHQEAGAVPKTRTLFRTGNRDLTGADFVWVDDTAITRRTRPADAVMIERLEWGPFYGWVQELRRPDGSVTGDVDAWAALSRELPAAHRRLAAMRRIERGVIGDINAAMERRRLGLKRLQLRGQLEGAAGDRRRAGYDQAIARLQADYERVAARLVTLRAEDAAVRVVLRSVEGATKELPVSSVVRVHRANALSWPGRVLVYLDRLREFVFEQPREANSEGGVAPAIFGTVLMTLLMTCAAVPLGVLTAIYVHEYAKAGPLVSIVRIAVNNLAGVPSIVFGVFGLGFFCYLVGGSLDQLFFPERLPTPTFGGGGILWASMTLALLTIPVVIVATEEALAAVPNGLREASLACGATKFQTIWNVVLPCALPGILTGTILAMARGAGEVAPLMITGVVKLAPEMPLDAVVPFLHLDRRFMHLGFHIYDVGFQSPNIEAAKPMVYMTTFLLLGVIVCLNLTAMRVRAALRERFRTAEV